MESHEISCCLGYLTKKYASGISNMRRGELAIVNAENILNKLGFRSSPKTKSPPKKKKNRRKSPSYNRCDTSIDKMPFTSAIVIEPRGNEPKYSKNQHENFDHFIIAERKNRDNRLIQPVYTKNLNYKKDNFDIETENFLSEAKKQRKKNPIRKSKSVPIQQYDFLDENKEIEENPNEIELTISIKPKDKKRRKNELELSASLKQNGGNEQEKKVKNHNKSKIAYDNNDKPTKMTIQQSESGNNKKHSKTSKNEQKNEKIYESINNNSLKNANQSQKIKEKRDFTKQIEHFNLIRLLDWFSLWQQKASDILHKEYTIVTMLKLRTRRNTFFKWLVRKNERIEKRKEYEDEMNNKIIYRKLQLLHHNLKLKVRHITYASYFNQWKSKVFRSSPSKKSPKKVDSIPVYLRPPDPLPPKKEVKPVVFDPRADDLIKRAEESKQKRLEQAKERIKQDDIKQKEKEKNEKIQQQKMREQHKKALVVEHENRQKKLKEEKIAQEKFKQRQKEKKLQEAKLEKAILFRKQQFFKKFHFILQFRKIQAKKAFQLYAKHLKKAGMQGFKMNVQEQDEIKLKKAEEYRKKQLKKLVINRLKRNITINKNFIENCRKKIGKYVVKCYLNEWRTICIEEKRANDFKAIQFYEKILLKKAFNGFREGIEKEKEDNNRQKKRDELMQKALQYLHENQFKKTSEFEPIVLKPGDTIIDDGTDEINKTNTKGNVLMPEKTIVQNEEEEEEEDDYSDMF